MTSFDKIGEFELQRLLHPKDTGHQVAEALGTAGGVAVGSGITGFAGQKLLPKITAIANPRKRALAALALLLGGVKAMALGGIGGHALANAVRPEKSRWKLLAQSL